MTECSLQSRHAGFSAVPVGPEISHVDVWYQLSGDAIHVLHDRCGHVLGALARNSTSALRERLLPLVQRIDLAEHGIRISLSLDSIDQCLIGSYQREIAIAIVRNGRQVKIVIPPPASREQSPNPSLLKLVAQAFTAKAEIDKGGSFLDVASRLGCGRETLADMLRTSYLAPSIIQAIVEGRQPANLSRKQLVQTNRIPLGWGEQEALFGFS